MSHYEYFLIFLALVFCGYASYTDLKTQKIRNFCSLGLLYVGALGQLMAWYLGTTTPLPKTPAYYIIVGFASVWLALQATPSVSVFLSGFAFFLGLYLVVFVIAKQLILSLASITLDNAVDVSGLEVGMIPAEQIVRVEQLDGTVRYQKQQVNFSSGQKDNIVISPDPVGLTAEEIFQLQNLAAEGAFAEFGNQINVQPSIRFAPVISVGALLTVLCQGPFYLKLMQLM